ncbi:PglL family O-oligosaccharyltransferase [Acinetobacter ursingii]|uniref:PglL family O-oligosaccharyltransferase n=1 Tax=Acinetobacter ursingii TaxID=108980 RepID=UPI000A7E5D9E|nr:O-antigen ligase family protein [Acinetobacter ursingii]MCH2004480.1 Wzy polymerase domain-containing protein [Acinetobacter ursingii]
MKNNIYFLISIVIGFSFLLPNHYYPWVSAYQDFSSFLVLIIIFAIFFKKQLVLDLNFLFLLLISLVPLIQILFHKIYFLGDSLIAFIYIASFSFTYVLALNLGRKNSIAPYLCFISNIFIFSSVVSLYIILKQWLLLTNGGIWMADLPPNGRPFANFGQPNNCATFLCMGLLACLYLYEKKYINQVCGVLLTSFILFGITLTQSRTAWAFTLAFLIWWFWKTRYFQARLSKYSVFYFVGIFLFFIFTVPYISDSLGVTNTTDAVTRASSGYLRIPMWHQMLLAIKEQPLWGYGWNQVSVAQLSVYLDYPTTEWTEHSHNILLDLLIWNGIPLGILIIGFFIWWLYRLSQLAISVEAFITLSMVGAVLVHAMLEYPLDYAFFLLPVGFLLGLVQAQDKTIKIIEIPRTVVASLWVIFVVLYIWIFVEYQIIEKDVQLVRFEALNIGTLHAEHDAPDVILLTQLREQIRFIRTPPKENMTLDQLDWMRKVAYRYSTSAALYRYAQALALNHQPELARKHLLILEKLHGQKYPFESLYQVNQSLAFEWQNKSGSKP